jgi:hypothetical protein
MGSVRYRISVAGLVRRAGRSRLDGNLSLPMENFRWKINLSGASLGFDRIFRDRNSGNRKKRAAPRAKPSRNGDGWSGSAPVATSSVDCENVCRRCRGEVRCGRIGWAAQPTKKGVDRRGGISSGRSVRRQSVIPAILWAECRSVTVRLRFLIASGRNMSRRIICTVTLIVVMRRI